MLSRNRTLVILLLVLVGYRAAGKSTLGQLLARRLDMPVVLHIRDAHEDAWSVVAEHPPRARDPGVVHCFTGTVPEARRWLELGFHISFSGISTFKKASELREAAALCPADRIMLETDAPYLAPEPLRGRKNEPANVAFTCARLAQVREDTPEELAKHITHPGLRKQIVRGMTLLTLIDGEASRENEKA